MKWFTVDQLFQKEEYLAVPKLDELFGLTFMTAVLFCHTPTVASVPVTELQIQKFAADFEKVSQGLQGGAVVVVHKNAVVYKKTFGHRHQKLGKIDEKTVFPLASISKAVSSLLIAKLVDQGKMSYETLLREAYPQADSKIQLKHLLSHSSGYDDLTGDRSVELGKERKRIIENLLKRKPEHTPGTSYFYSNIIYSLIQEVILKQTGQSYSQQMKEFLSAIGISHPGVCKLDSEHVLAEPHTWIAKKKRWIARGTPPQYPKTVCASAGIYISINDAALLIQLALGQLPTVLKTSQVKVTTAPVILSPEFFTHWGFKWPFPIEDLNLHYAMGWRILSLKNESRPPLIFHGGALSGVKTFLGFIPEKDIGIAIFVNQDAMLPSNQGFEFWKQMTDPGPF
jgi:beta-lactamase class C